VPTSAVFRGTWLVGADRRPRRGSHAPPKAQINDTLPWAD